MTDKWLHYCFEQQHDAICTRQRDHVEKGYNWHFGVEQLYPFRLVLWDDGDGVVIAHDKFEIVAAMMLKTVKEGQANGDTKAV